MFQQFALIGFLLLASQCYSITVEPDTVVISRTRGEWGVVLCIVDDLSALVCWDKLIPGHLAVGAGWIEEQTTKRNCSYNTLLSCVNQTLINGTSFEYIHDLASADDTNFTYEGMTFRFILYST
jgi:hypothetical protein